MDVLHGEFSFVGRLGSILLVDSFVFSRRRHHYFAKVRSPYRAHTAETTRRNDGAAPLPEPVVKRLESECDRLFRRKSDRRKECLETVPSVSESSHFAPSPVDVMVIFLRFLCLWGGGAAEAAEAAEAEKEAKGAEEEEAEVEDVEEASEAPPAVMEDE